ncbi:hypothetical protein [uncultured Muribaculum sp.]|uniref:hypothetical protein n=1 Tax=uncultured Muribaculum sp. TaxID=1918613 RepID=UPI0025D17738|nr:hypothetical protein [uncultured Muribaculum sp.]
MKRLYTILGAIALAAAVMTQNVAAQQAGYTMLKYTVTPADGETVDALETIVIDFPDPVDGIDAHISPSNIGNYATLTCGSTVIKAQKLEAGTREISKAYISFPKTTVPGTYVLSIDEGVFMDYEQSESHDEGEGYSVNPPITATYTIKGALPETTMSKYTLDPADGSEVTSLSTIIVSFPTTNNYDGIDIYSYSNKAVLKKNGETVATSSSIEVMDDYYSARIIFDTSVKEAGTYTLIIPAETFKDYSTSGDEAVTNYEITATYTIKGTSGIDEVEDAVVDTPATVYDLYGRRMKNADVHKLDPGLYIVNGKKVFVRR